MSKYAISLVQAGWLATDSRPRRVLLTATRRASYAWTALSVVAVLAAVAS